MIHHIVFLLTKTQGMKEQLWWNSLYVTQNLRGISIFFKNSEIYILVLNYLFQILSHCMVICAH